MTDQPPINRETSPHTHRDSKPSSLHPEQITPLRRSKSFELPKRVTESLSDSLNREAAQIASTAMTSIGGYLQANDRLRSKSEGNLRTSVIETSSSRVPETTDASTSVASTKVEAKTPLTTADKTTTETDHDILETQEKQKLRLENLAKEQRVKDLAKKIWKIEYQGGRIDWVNGIPWFDSNNRKAFKNKLADVYEDATIIPAEQAKMNRDQTFYLSDSEGKNVTVEHFPSWDQKVHKMEEVHKKYTESIKKLAKEVLGREYNGEEIRTVNGHLWFNSSYDEFINEFKGQFGKLSEANQEQLKRGESFDFLHNGSKYTVESPGLDKNVQDLTKMQKEYTESIKKLAKEVLGREYNGEEIRTVNGHLWFNSSYHAFIDEFEGYIGGSLSTANQEQLKRGEPFDVSGSQFTIKHLDLVHSVRELEKLYREYKEIIQKLHKEMFGKDVKPKDACGYVVEVKDSKLKKALGMKDTEKKKFFTVDELNALTENNRILRPNNPHSNNPYKVYKERTARSKLQEYNNQVAKIAKMEPDDPSCKFDLLGGEIEVRRVGLDQTQQELKKKQEEIDNRTAELIKGTDVYGYRVIEVVDNKGGNLGEIKQDTIEVITDRPKAQGKVQKDYSLEAKDNKDLDDVKIGENIKYSSEDGDGSYIEYQRIGSYELMVELEGRDVCDTINNNTDQNNPSLLSQYYNADMFTKAEPIHVGGDNDYKNWKTVYAAEVEGKLIFAKDEKSIKAKFPGKHIERLSKDEAKKRLEKLIKDRKAPSKVHEAIEDKIIETFKKQNIPGVDWDKAKDKDGNSIKPHVSLKCQDLDKFYVFEHEDGRCYYGRSLYAAAEHLNIKAGDLKTLEIGMGRLCFTNYNRHNGKILKPWTYYRFTEDAVKPLESMVTRRELNDDERKKLEQGMKSGEIEVILPETMYLYQDNTSGALTITDDQEEYGKNLTDYKLVKQVSGKDISDNMKKPDLPDTPQTRVDMVNGLEDDEMAKMWDDYNEIYDVCGEFNDVNVTTSEMWTEITNNSEIHSEEHISESEQLPKIKDEQEKRRCINKMKGRAKQSLKAAIDVGENVDKSTLSDTQKTNLESLLKKSRELLKKQGGVVA